MKIYKWVVIFKCQYCLLLLPLKSISKGGKSNSSSIHGIIIFHFNFLCVTLFQVPHHASFSPIVEQSSQPQHQLSSNRISSEIWSPKIDDCHFQTVVITLMLICFWNYCCSSLTHFLWLSTWRKISSMIADCFFFSLPWSHSLLYHSGSFKVIPMFFPKCVLTLEKFFLNSQFVGGASCHVLLQML